MPRPPALQALLLQLCAAGLVLLLARWLPGRMSPAIAAAVCGLFAAAGAWLLRMDRWWILISALFAPALVLVLGLGWPPWVFLVAFFGLSLLFWSTIRSRVPLYLSGPRTWQAVTATLPPPQSGHVVRCADLGSGFGGLLLYLVRQRADVVCDGFEMAPLPFAVSWLRTRVAGTSRARIHWRNFWSQDLGRYDLVFAFLSPVPMADLWQKARRELRPGALLVSCAFEVPGVAATRVIELSSGRQSRLYVYVMGSSP